MSSKSSTFGRYRALKVVGVLAFATLWVQPALADAVKIEGQWITQGVTVIRIEDGKIIYSVRGSETQDQLVNLQGMRLDAFPDLAEAQKNLADGKPNEAITQLKRVIAATSQQIWARQYAENLLMQANDQANKPAEVWLTFRKMADEKAPADYLAKPPTGAISRASDTIKKDLRTRITTAMPRLPEDARAGAQLLLKATGEEVAKPTAPAATPATPTAPATPATPAATAAPSTPAAPVTPSAAVPATPASAAPATPAASADPNAPEIPAGLPKNIPVTYEGVKLYREGKYEETLNWVDEQLKTAQQNFSFFFYMRGLALYAIAEKTNDEAKFLDAGVSFMKCAIFFPRDMYAGPAYLETARVYVKLGKLKQAKKLLNKATPMIMEEPGLEGKIEQLQAALKELGDTPAAAPKDNY